MFETRYWSRVTWKPGVLPGSIHTAWDASQPGPIQLNFHRQYRK